MSLITDGQVLLDLTANDRHAATRMLAETLAGSGRCTDVEAFLADVRAREEKMATGLPGGIGIPHARSSAITEPSLVFGRATGGIDWGAKDGPAHLIFLIAAPEAGGEAHMQMLPKLARALMKKEFKEALLAAVTPAEVVGIVNREVALDPPAEPVSPSRDANAATPPASSPASAAAGGAVTSRPSAPQAQESAPSDAASATGRRALRIVGVTSCPTGIAHTYMAAEGLERAAKAAGHTILVETQGSAGSTPLTIAQIAEADGVIFAHDLPVKDVGRFAGKPTIDVGVKRGISDGPELVTELEGLVEAWAADPEKARAAAAATGGGGSSGMVTKVDASASVGTRIRQTLMTGVSYMIPFVAAGGILIALGFMLSNFAIGKDGPVEIVKYGLTAEGTYNLVEHFNPISLTSWAALLFVIGGAAFAFLVPILSGFIAYAIADRPGLVPGIVGGSIATTMGAGFLGGLATGFLGGYVAKWVARWKVHKNVRGIMPVVVIPLVSTVITAGLFITVLGRPITWLMNALNDALEGMTGTSAILLGLILGAMMGFDLGGPVNKVAYTFGVAGLSEALSNNLPADAAQYKIMAAVMAAGMVAPLAMALATSLRPKLFTEPERENGKAAWLLGASFISEGAIPFAAADPVRVIVSSVVGSAITGAIAMGFGTSLMAPHGGIWVGLLIGKFWAFVLALLVGMVVMAGIVLFLKQRDHSISAVVDAVEA